MAHNEFNHLLSSINALSPDQARRLARELESRIAATKKRPAPAKAGASPDAAEETAFDLASRAGLIGDGPGPTAVPAALSRRDGGCPAGPDRPGAGDRGGRRTAGQRGLNWCQLA
jgi:hypothetical protein